jgi:hypothetical protein
MRILSASAIAVLFVLFSASSSQATPTSGADCLQCHSASTGHLTISGNTSTLNLGTQRLDKVKAGAVKTFSVKRGQAVTITIDVPNGASRYDVSVFRKTVSGLKTKLTNRLLFKADAKWKLIGGTGGYYLASASAINWAGSTRRFTYTLTVNAKTPVDVYEFFIEVGGMSGGRWAQGQRVYINVTL